jgi:hypothetical protein
MNKYLDLREGSLAKNEPGKQLSIRFEGNKQKVFQKSKGKVLLFRFLELFVSNL